MNTFLPLHQYHRFAMVSNGKSSTSKNERIQFMLSLIDTHTHTTMEMAKNGIRFRRSHLSCSSFSVSSHCVNTRCEFFFYSALSFFFHVCTPPFSIEMVLFFFLFIVEFVANGSKHISHFQPKIKSSSV